MKGKRRGEAVGRHSKLPSHHRSFLLPNYPDTSLCYLVSSATTCGYVCLHKREKGTIRFFFCNFFLFLKKTFGPDPPLRHRCGPFCVPPRRGRKEKERRKNAGLSGGERAGRKGAAEQGRSWERETGGIRSPAMADKKRTLPFLSSFLSSLLFLLPHIPTYADG